MPQTIIIQSAPFSLLAVAQGTDASTLLLSYTMAPDAISPLIATDALNPTNYTITGPSITGVSLVTPLSSYMFSLTLTAPLVSGSYVISVANVESAGAALGAPTSLIFQALAGEPKEPVNQGADNDLTENVLRRWLPPQYRYKTAWEALIAAIESGDRFVRENAYNAFDQLFISSALRPYLFQRAADYGVTYPGQVGMSDDLFRQLTIKTTAKKLVHQALLEILEVFYGEDATRANITAGLYEPYVIRTGDSISFQFDDRDDATVTFNSADFSNISVATASEVAAVMTRAFRAAGLSAYAAARHQDAGTTIKVYSGALGLLGSVQVTGGMAQNVIQFPTRLPTITMGAPAPQWEGLRISQDEFRFTWVRDYFPDFLRAVEVGDYVLLDLVNASTLRGSYVVTDVHIDVDLFTGNPNGLTWFSIAPGAAFPYAYNTGATIDMTNANEIVFYSIVRQSVAQNINPSFIAQYANRGVDVVLPATTQAVDRGATDAAYPPVNSAVGVVSITRSGNIATVVTTVNHGLTAGSSVVEIYDVEGATAGQWNIFGQVLTTPSLSSFTIASPGVDGFGTGGYVLPVAAAASPGIIPGPFAFDPDAGFAVTGVSSTSTDAIAGNRGVGTLHVVDTSGFSSDGGYLVFGFGTQYEIGPVKYVAILDSTTLLIDRTFTFPNDIPAGFDVTLLYQNTPWVPADVTEVGAFYLTDSSSGRIAAEDFINNAVASGVDVVNKIVYPGDRGIGGQGLPITGIKISDKVEVWAGDDVDQEVAAAHNG